MARSIRMGGLAIAITLVAGAALGEPIAPRPAGTAKLGGSPQPTISPTLTRPPLLGPLQPATPSVTMRADSAGTTATDASFETRLTGTSFEWSFGGGAIPDRATTTSAVSPRVVLGRPGTYRVRVTAGGVEAAASYEVRAFTSTTAVIQPAMRARGAWNTYSLVALSGGEPALVQCGLATTPLRHFLRLFVKRGAVWGESPIADVADGCYSPRAALGADGRLRVVMRENETSRRFFFYVARNAAPASPADWERTTFDLDVAPAAKLQLALRRDDLPVISFVAGDSRIRVLVARSRLPATATDWTTSAPWPHAVGPHAFTLLADRPALMFRTELPPDPANGVRMMIANGTNPASAKDYRVMTLPRPPIEASFGGYDPALAVMGGKLIGVHREVGHLKLVRATIENPSSTSDFVVTSIDERTAMPFPDGVPSGIATFQGRPVVFYQSSTEQRIAVARATAPTSAADWAITSFPTSTSFAALTVADGPGKNAILSAEWGGLSALMERQTR